MSTSDAIPGYTTYRGNAGLYNVLSYVPQGWKDNVTYAQFDGFGNMRVNRDLTISTGAGDGGYNYQAVPSGAVPCRSGDDGDIQYGDVVSGLIPRGHYCIKPVASVGCPLIGGREAVKVEYHRSEEEAGSESRPATNRNIICWYPPDAFDQPTSLTDWNREFLSNNPNDPNYARNLRTKEMYILPSFCSERVTTCFPDDATQQPIAECPRWTANDDLSINECRAWLDRGRSDPIVRSQVDTAMLAYCAQEENARLHECQCINANLDQTYTDIVEFASTTGTSIPGENGCWYAPCVYDQSHMVRINDECTLTEVTQCSFYTNIYGNEGIVYQELGQTIQCGGDIPAEPSNPVGGSSGLGEGVENWAWWVWLIIAVLGLIVILFIGWLLFKVLRPSPTPTAAPAPAPETAYVGAY